MRSRVRFPALTWEFFLVGEDPHGDHGLVLSRFRLKGPSRYLIFIYITPLISLGQRSRALWAPQPQKSATLSPQPGGKTTKFVLTGGGIITFNFLIRAVYNWLFENAAGFSAKFHSIVQITNNFKVLILSYKVNILNPARCRYSY